MGSLIKQQRRRPPQKRTLKSEVAPLDSAYSISSPSIREMWANFSVVDINRFEVEDMKKKVLFLCSRLPKNVKLGTLTSS